MGWRAAPGAARARRPLLAAVVSLLWLILTQTAVGHEARQVGTYDLQVGLIGEPFLQGPRYGFELSIAAAGLPVDGAEGTLRAEVSSGGATHDLNLVAVEAGRYQALFSPEVDASYRFRLLGTIGDLSVDETFAFHLLPASVMGGSAASDRAQSEPGLPLDVIGLLVPIGLGIALVIARRRAARSSSSVPAVD